MANRKLIRSGQKMNCIPTEIRKSVTKVTLANDFYCQRMLTQTFQDNQQVEFERAIKNMDSNLKNCKSGDLEKLMQRRSQDKVFSTNKIKKNLGEEPKGQKRIVLGKSKIHPNINLKNQENNKKNDDHPKVLLTEWNGENTNEFGWKKDQEKQFSRIFLKKEKKSLAKTLAKSKQKVMESTMKQKIPKTGENEQDFELTTLNKIGEGTFGKVYKAKYNGKLVAVKKVYQDKKYKNRELEIIKMLKSEFVMKVHHTFFTKQICKKTKEELDYLNVVMEHYQHNLSQIIETTNTMLSDIQIKLYAYQLFRGLMYIHSLGICHRDIKPPNILVNKKTNKLVICDFGSAKVLAPNQSNIAYICSRCYRAPQLIFGSVLYTTKVDIWSAGCVILQMLKGQPFFIGSCNLDQLVEIIKILGTPSKTEVINMNPQYDLDNYKFPKIKIKQWRTIFPKTDQKLISLLKKVVVYNPSERLDAAEVLAHEYFDQLRQQNKYKELQLKKNIPSLFDFQRQQLENHKHLIQRLIPKWYRPRK